MPKNVIGYTVYIKIFLNVRFKNLLLSVSKLALLPSMIKLANNGKRINIVQTIEQYRLKYMFSSQQLDNMLRTAYTPNTSISAAA
jgi:hypothetical protein